MSEAVSLFPQQGIDHASRLHGGGSGWVVIANRTNDGGWKEKAVRAAELDDFLRYYYPHTENVYITQNRFRDKRRRVGLLGEIDALWCDIDFYSSPDLAEIHPLFIADEARLILEREKIPEPGIIISSGRGVYLLWLIDAVSPYELQRWNRCQKRITEAMQSLKADRNAIDAARVLRLPGTINTKNGARVEVLHSSETVWNFDDLYYEIITDKPETIITDIRTERAKRRRIVTVPGSWSAQSLWSGRYFDLLKLKDHRWPSGIPEGRRDLFLFLSSVALSWITEPGMIRPEVTALARHCRGKWSDKDTDGSTKAAIERAIQAAKGERIEWKGIEIDPRYRFKTDTIIDLLGIEPREIRDLNLRFLLTEEIRKERDSLRKRPQIHASPIQAEICATYTPRENSLMARRPWEEEGISRRTWYRREAERKARESQGEQALKQVGRSEIE